MKKSVGERVDKIIENLFGIIAFGVLCFFVIGYIVFPDERQKDIFKCQPLETDWYQVMEDGSKSAVKVPGICDATRGEEVTITTTIPQDFDTDEMPWLCFHSTLQDMKVYIDGELRGTYTTEDTRLWGKYSVSAYMFVALEESDNGKEMTVSMTTDSKYTGVINGVYCGTVFGMYMQYAKGNVFEVISALFMLVLALGAIIVSAFLKIKMKKSFYLSYLGWGELFLSIWILSESPMRQLYYQNISLAGYMTHFMVYLFAIPIIIFMNYVQKHRYNRIYRGILVAELAFFVIGSSLEITGIGDFSVLFNISILLHICAIICIIRAFIADIKSGFAKSYRQIIYGFCGFALGAFLQLYLYTRHTIIFHGGVLCIGAIFWLLMTVVSSFKDYFTLERENARNRLKAEKLTYQIMETLVQTIEAKDNYTKGHSARVAEYSRALAEKMGMTQEEQNEIYYMGMLHDIGKIGIADTIINKQGKLTDEEYAAIKTHPIVGYNILKNMDEIKDIENGARWHHERYDGKGYPDGLAGEEIPLYARIIAVADMYDAMTSNRSYRSVLPQKQVRDEIERVSGSQLDPVVAKYMLQLIDEDINYIMRQEVGLQYKDNWSHT